MFKKLMWAFTGLILIGVLITGLLSMEIAKTYYFNSVEDKLVTSAKLIRTVLEDSTAESPPQYNELCSQFSSIIGERVTIIGWDGTVLGDSDANVQDMADHSDRPEVKQALKEGLGKDTRQSVTLGKGMLYIALAMEDRQSEAGIIRVALPLDDIAAINQRIWYYIFFAVFVGIAAAVALGYRYLSTLTRPIGEMTEMARTIAGGKFNKRVQVKGSAEIGTLASAFNHMAERMEKTVEELVNDKSKIEAILASSVNGVVAVDNNGNTMFLNPVAERMLDIRGQDVIGRPLFDIVCNKEAERILRNVLKTQRGQIMGFELPWLKNRTIKVIMAPIRPKVKHSRTIGTLIIIQDITTVKKLEKIRSDFVANVTHELKTPLTSIKGFIETLREGAAEDPDKRNRFLEIIDVETERLERLIEDILLLSEIESGSPSSMPAEEIDVGRIIRDEVLSIFAKKAREKDITIGTNFATGLPGLAMNRDRFKQMLINLVDNAIKFTDRGGEVTVSAYTQNRYMVLKVGDNGIGIPKEHQDRVFERFYRVDRGRSSKEGGTGLGLAIVKHIALSVNGSVEVESKPGLGTEFTVRIPMK